MTKVSCCGHCWGQEESVASGHSSLPLTGCQQEFSPLEDVHTVASLFKLYLRELPEPLVPFLYYDKFQAVMKSKLHSHWYAPGLDVVVDSFLCSVGEWCGHCGGGTPETTYSAAESKLQYFEICGVSCFFTLSHGLCSHTMLCSLSQPVPTWSAGVLRRQQDDSTQPQHCLWTKLPAATGIQQSSLFPLLN